jgi:hypothetical protein
VNKATADKYLRDKRGHIYWCLVDSEKVFDLTDRDALWYKMRQKEISENMVERIRKMYDGIKFCVKSDDNEVTDFVDQRKGVR